MLKEELLLQNRVQQWDRYLTVTRTYF